MRMTFGFLQVTFKYYYRRGNTIIYQRAVPTDLRSRYPGATVKHDLKTSDISIAEKAVAALSKRYETEWAGLRSAPESSLASLKAVTSYWLRAVKGGTPHGQDLGS